MISYRKLIPCIYIAGGKAIKWFNDREVLADNVVELAKHYSDRGADELLIFDLSDSDDDHEASLNLLRQIHNVISIPMVAGGNIKRMEDVQRILYSGAKRVILNFSKPDSAEMMAKAAERFGKEKVAVSLDDFDGLFKHQHLIEDNCSQLIFMHRLDLNSVVAVTDIPCVIVTDTMEELELFKILKSEGVKGLSGRYISQPEMNFNDFKELCEKEDIQMTSFESIMEFSQFKKNPQGLLPVIVQHYQTGEVLMLAYMNEEAFNQAVKTGRMTYYSRSRQKLWLKGETSGHFQYVKSLTIDCDLDTLLAKVDQVGAACHTGNPTCFFQPIVGSDNNEKSPVQVFEHVYQTIIDRKNNPKEGSYTNYLFEQGQDKILKKIGEEATGIVIASKNPNPEELKTEMADFLYHAMVLMVEKGITWEDITNQLLQK